MIDLDTGASISRSNLSKNSYYYVEKVDEGGGSQTLKLAQVMR